MSRQLKKRKKIHDKLLIILSHSTPLFRVVYGNTGLLKLKKSAVHESQMTDLINY